MKMLKNKEKSAPFNLSKEIKLLPGYIILILWVAFTAVLLGWVVAASLSTTADIFSGDILGFKTGLHFENYAKAWVSSNVSVFFVNSLIYAVLSCVFIILGKKISYLRTGRNYGCSSYNGNNTFVYIGGGSRVTW